MTTALWRQKLGEFARKLLEFSYKFVTCTSFGVSRILRKASHFLGRIEGRAEHSRQL